MRAFFAFPALLVSLLVGPAIAQDERPPDADGNTLVVLPAGVVINNDYFASGERVEIFGTVNGDVYVAGGQILVDGTVNGDLLAAGGSIVVSGTVTQDARVAGGQVAIEGRIDRNLSVAGGNVELNESALVGGGLVAAGGRVRVASPVGKDAKLAGGDVTVSGPISGNVHAAARDLRLTSRAAIVGNLTYWSGGEALIDPDATVGGAVTRKAVPDFPRLRAGALVGALAGLLLIVKVVSLVSTLVIGLLAIALFPGYTESAVSTLRERPWASLGIGFIALALTPVAAGILLITVLGAPLALVVMALYFVAIYLARVVAILWVGGALFRVLGKDVRDAWALVIGLVIYAIVTLIPVIGGLVTLLVILFGLGASLLADRTPSLSARRTGTA